MKAEIIAIGTEILLGDIVNSNAQYLGQEMASLGIDMHYQQVVGDNEKRIIHAFDEAYSRSDIVITTGGLGPTEDDLTKEVAAKYFNKKLIPHENSIKRIKEYFEFRQKRMPENNLKQGLIPEGCIVIKNNNGTAPGVIIEENNKTMIILPGPPKEMKPMFEEAVRPYFQKKSDSVLVSKMIKILGVGESTIAEELKDLMESQINPTIAPYAKEVGVIVRVTAKARTEEEAVKLIIPIEEEIKKRLGDNVYAIEDIDLEEVVAKLLIEKKLTISTAESCTGGMIASTLINYPGISEVLLEGAVTYSNEAKHKRLGVKNETLDKYGAVSEETAMEMAIGIAKTAGTDVSIVTTGIAGPGGGTKEKPVGLVYVGIYVKGKVEVQKCMFNGNRSRVRLQATITGLDMLRRNLIKK
ncbi:competence/damage-inducible protein A [Clostridium saccharobutylicum]|uniref:Putative competence-damage inducible protein n=1 Tax=Clostridium saccharobutylicum DSM 13864 TaxID=1345695 RepID=U5MWX4_CLOSA|nr:competence/damage-inducible protein A [Clostridium saccharobutylicum]AGX45304.1 putative competence-damage inducible protein CinA [Clostridium saccharobutylicum DSM 13864]AQR92578.1 putative competence-damage inducible protein [Clostridium saccharobutylicum]AQS02480.1 putative competence-damage inducible protein [Clostridium saccharobutylicum]AQS12083.1 putative competence-damage inducible protein [Clostridium saccharobutylicum]AQS16463.1 putative competence-damage inducible protein [Clostr